MSNAQILALRRALIKAETEIMNARHELALKDEELDKARIIIGPRIELRWPWGCHSVRKCMGHRRCEGGCATHAGRDMEACIKDALAIAEMVTRP